MARYKLTKGGKKPTAAPQGGLYGCLLVVLLIMAFVGWTFYLAMQPQ
ncbi:MAG: hypothetical protein O3A53_20330 [Acidobacteria bacterium]|nr:hypothetical protein [Acidobacteriota bacterium]MDA1237126.1 hypothetical protein [Acidobacteriota bacterium]